jgi:hypothetical protein
VDELASTDDHQFQLTPPMGQFLSSGRTANFSDDHGLPSLGKILPHPKQIVDLKLADDEDDDDDNNTTKVS